MKFDMFKGTLPSFDSDLITVGAYSPVDWDNGALSVLNDSLGGLLAEVSKEEGFDGKNGQQLKLHTHGKIKARRILCVGLGERGATDGRTLAAHGARAARGMGLSSLGIVAPNDDPANTGWMVQGALLGQYSFDQLKTKDVKPSKLANVSLLESKAKNGAVKRGETIANAVNLARDLVNDPPINVTPTRMADEAKAIAKANKLDCIIYDKKALEKKGMRLILAVSAGSTEEPRLIHLTYKPAKVTKNTPSIALVGKGLTFDAGGLCLKPYGSIEDMKIDMAGGAAILGAMKAIHAAKPDVIVHGIVPSSENMTGASAYKPGDVIKSYNGKSVEVLNTDAEGRLILADALHYATELGVDEIIDCATLTGAICVALGNDTAGIFGNDAGLVSEIEACAKAAGETMWHMPLDHRLKKQLKSDIADMRNVGKRWGGAITAALFLEEFVGDTRWVHIDLAGPALADKATDHVCKGGTGFGVATLVEYAARAGKRLKAKKK